MNTRPLLIQFQDVPVLDQTTFWVTSVAVIFRKFEIGFRITRTQLELGIQIVVRCLSVAVIAQVFAVTLSVIEPDIPGKLTCAIDGLADCILYQLRAERALER